MNIFQLKDIKNIFEGKIRTTREMIRVLNYILIHQKNLVPTLNKQQAQLIYNQFLLNGLTSAGRTFKHLYLIKSKINLKEEIKPGVVNKPDTTNPKNYTGSATLPKDWQEKRYMKAQKEFYERRSEQLRHGVPASFIKGPKKVGGYYYRGARFDELPVKYLIFLAEKNKVPHHLKKAFAAFYYSTDTQKRVRDYLADRDTKPGGIEDVDMLRRGKSTGYSGPVGPNVKEPRVQRKIYDKDGPIAQNVPDTKTSPGTHISSDTEYSFSRRAGGDFAVSDEVDLHRIRQDRYRGMPYEELISFDRIESRDRAEFQKVSGGWVRALPGYMRKSARENLEAWRQWTITTELSDLLETRRQMGQADPDEMRKPRTSQNKLEYEELNKLGKGIDLRKFDVLGRVDQAKNREELQEIIDDLDTSGLGVSLMWRQRLPNLVDYIRDKSNLLAGPNSTST